MAVSTSFDIAHTALLAMDCQAGIVSIYAKPQEEFVARAAQVLRAARTAGMAVIHVQVGFRPGLPEVSSRNKLFAGVKANPQHQSFFQGASGAIHPALGPEANDLVVTKHRVSAFAGTDLEMLLRAKKIETLVMFGIATSGVVLSTLLEAGDADYRVVVIDDCCADLDAELHSALLKRLFPKRAEVLTADEFVKTLESRVAAGAKLQ
jgi:nicotinamidase-related amidase